jgi:hypothetical protein
VAFAAQLAARGSAVLVLPAKDQRARMPAMLLKVIAGWRNRVKATFGQITDRMELAGRGRPYLAVHLLRRRVDQPT